jgi:hypothetical protein
MSQLKTRYFTSGWIVLLSILGDTADFGRIKERFHYCLCLSLQEIEPGGCDFLNF